MSKSNITIPTDWVTALDMQMVQNYSSGTNLDDPELYDAAGFGTIVLSNADVSSSYTNPPVHVNISGVTAIVYSKTFNINTNDGLTLIVYFAFRGTAVNSERVIDFGASGSSNDQNIFFIRNGTDTAMRFDIREGTSQAGNLATASGTCPQNEFAVWTARYTNSTKFYEIFKNGELLASTTGTLNVSDKTSLANCRIGRGTNGSAQSNIDLVGAYTYDRVLSLEEISAVSNHLMNCTSPSLTYPVVQTIPKQIENQVHNGGVTNVGVLDGSAVYYGGSTSDFTDIQDVPCLPFSISMWFNTSESTLQRSILGICDTTRVYNGLNVENNFYASSTILVASVLGTNQVSSNYSVSVGTWYHLVLRLNLNNTVDIYMNGSLHQTLTGSALPAGSCRIILGNNSEGTRGFNGYIKNFQLFDYTLRADEVADLYLGIPHIPKLVGGKTLVNSTNWYTEMTIAQVSGSFVPVSSGTAPNVTYQIADAGTTNTQNHIYQQVAIQEYSSFTCTFQFKMENAAADEVYFFCGRATGTSTTGGYYVYFDVYNPPEISLYNPSDTKVVTIPIYYYKNSSEFNTVVIEYNRNSVKDNWKITLNDQLIVVYTVDDSWVASAGEYWGLGARTGGQTHDSWVRNVELQYTPRETKMSEVQKNIKDIKLPIATMKAGNTVAIPGNTPFNGTYIASVSSQFSSFGPNRTFSGAFVSADTVGWHSAQTYNTTTGVYEGAVSTTSSSIAYTGEWIQLQIPNAIRLVKFSIYPRDIILTRAPINFVMCGSNDGSTWTTLHIETGYTWTVAEHTFPCNQGVNSAFNYFRLVGTLFSTSMNGGYFNINNISLFPAISLGSPINNEDLGLIDGLTWKYYDGANGTGGAVPSDNDYYSDNTYRAIGTFTDGTNIGTITNGKYLSLDYYSVEIFGYFKAPVSGTYTFYITADDGASMWIDNQILYGNVMTGYTSGNATLNAPYASGEVSVSIEMLAGVYHPIRIQHHENVGGGNHLVIAFTPPGGSQTFDGTGYFFSSNGLNEAYPAESAKIVKDITGTNKDGVRYINCNGVSTPIYCLMNDAYDGGGWMMLMKATTGSTLQYTSTHWTTTTTLNSTDTTRTNADAKYDSYNYQKVKDVLTVWPDIDPDSYTNVNGKKGGSFYVKDGWIWLLTNWNAPSTTNRVTPLAGFTNPRVVGGVGSTFLGAGISDPRNYNGFSYGAFSSQTVGSIVHFIAGSAGGGFRWGFIWNDTVGSYTGSNVVSGIGMNGSSGLDWNDGGGGAIGGINRQARFELFGR